MIFVPYNFLHHAQWIKEHIKCTICEDTLGIVALRDGEIVAAMVADSWAHNSVQVHIAIKDPLVFKHGMHFEFFDWIFNKTGRGVMLALIPANNAKALKLNEHLGFTEFARIPDGFRVGEDFIARQLRKESCKYINQNEEVA